MGLSQTDWFPAMIAAASLGLLYTLYRYRTGQLVHDFKVRSEERVHERARIARELHDTLLQSFQGSLIEFQAARNLLPGRLDDAIHALDDAIRSAEAAIAEGRDTIHNLRSGLEVRGDLAHLYSAAGRELSDAQASNANGPEFRVLVEGAPQALLPLLHDELYRIGREILRNAFRHAQAGRIEVEVRYDADEIRLRFRDDGIGIDPKVFEAGARPGHWGLPGVCERAKLIGARLDIWSELGAGTEVQLVLPAVLAYAESRERAACRVFRGGTRPHAG